MKIQYALMSCTANPRYTEYWPTVAAAWLKLGITPVCLFIPDDPTVKLPEVPGGIVHTIPPLKDVHIAIQGLTLRFWGSYLYPKAIVVVSDIDAVPLSKDFFVTQLAAYAPHAYLHLQHRPDGYDFCAIANIPDKTTRIDRMRFLLSYFHIARGEVMHRVLGFSPDWETSCKKTVAYYLHNKAKITLTGRLFWSPHRGLVPLCGDEIWTSLRLHHSEYHPIFYISHQLDHRYAGFIARDNLFNRNIRQGAHYTYAHFSPLRYSRYKNIIEHIITKDYLPKFYLFWGWFVDHAQDPSKKIKIIGPWLSFIWMVLIWCVLHAFTAMRLFPALSEYSRVLLEDLFCKRAKWLEQSPLITRLYHRLLRVKAALFSS